MVSSQRLAFACLIAGLLIAAPGAAWAQRDAAVTRNDIQQLQLEIDRVARDVADLRGPAPDRASSLSRELDDASDEAVYLKVKISKGEPVSRRELDDLRARVASLAERVRDDAGRRAYPPPPPPSDPDRGRIDDRREPFRTGTPGVIPVGTEFDVRLIDGLRSDTARPEDRFTATTVVDLFQGDRVLVPAGSAVRGIVQSVNKATRTERRGSVSVTFDRLTIGHTSHPIRATVTQALESEGMRGEAGRIGAGAGVGAIIGGILGGVKGALAGILIGGGGMVAATEGTDVSLPPGTVLRVRLDSPLDLR